jgi:Na+/melibiose symporter-like transporter
MIQRKQTLWLFLAALVGAGVFYFDLYHGDIKTGDIMQGKVLSVRDKFPLLLIAVVMVTLPLITIFMFGNRKRQMRMTAMCMLSVMSFVSLMLATVTSWERASPPVLGGSYSVGAVLPVVSVILLIMALLGIRKDEKLVRSVDRLR